MDTMVNITTSQPLPTIRLGQFYWPGKNGAGDGDRTRNIQLGNQNFRSFILNTYKIAQEKMYMHALHTVHALPDLRVAAGRLRDGVSNFVTSKHRTSAASNERD
jgi:hypothetical protein